MWKAWTSNKGNINGILTRSNSIEKDASQNEATSTVWKFKKHLPRQAKVLLDNDKQVRKRTAQSSKRETWS